MTSNHGKPRVRKWFSRIRNKLAVAPIAQLGAPLVYTRVAMKNPDGDARLEKPSPKWRLVRLLPLPRWHHRSPRPQDKFLNLQPTLSNWNHSHLREERQVTEGRTGRGLEAWQKKKTP